MMNLIQAYFTDRSDKNAVKVVRYLAKHPMSVCMLNKQENDLINAAVQQAAS